jgi:hypothetical protein
MTDPSARRDESSPESLAAPAISPTSRGHSLKYDVTISFAGPQHKLARRLARYLRLGGFSVYLYEEHLADVWGQRLEDVLTRTYRDEAHFCVIFLSQEYFRRVWPRVELRAAVERAARAQGSDAEYILPIEVEQVEVPESLASIAWVSLSNHSIEQIALLLLRRLFRARLARVRAYLVPALFLLLGLLAGGRLVLAAQPRPLSAVKAGLEAACLQGRAQACTRLGNALLREPEASHARAGDWLQRGCASGDEQGCAHLAELHGKQPGPRREDAQQLRRIACNAGDEGSCPKR